MALLGISSLAVSHMAAMPAPDKMTRMASASAALRRDSTSLFYVHVIYERCSCTARLRAHLLQRGRREGVEESIVFVGEARSEATARAASQAGFAFHHLTARQLGERFGLQAAPVLLAFDARGGMLCAGGYFDRPAAIDAPDERIHRTLASGAVPTTLPVFGCAVDETLQKSVDPLGIVYRRG